MTDFHESLPLMDTEAQQVYIATMLGSSELFARVQHIISASYFDDSLKTQIGFLKSYYNEYKNLPSPPIFNAHTKSTIQPVLVPPSDIQFMANELAKFCKIKAVIQSVLKAPELIREGELGKMVSDITKATQIALHSDLGIDYFNEPEARLIYSSEQEQTIPTGWKDVDELTNGIGRQELILFLAPSGGGKSVGMLNLAMNLLKQGLNGVYISLEMRDRVVAKRLDSMISQFSGKDIFRNIPKVADEIELFKGEHDCRFFVKRMREGSTTANDISAYLHELQTTKGFKIDFVVVDYLDLMKPIESIKSDNIFLKEKFITEEVRALGMDFDCIMISAAQLGRDSWEQIRQGKDLGQDHIQGGMSKINTSDLAIAVIKDEAMDAAGEMKFQFLKSRNSGAVNKKLLKTWNKISLRIGDMSEQQLTNRPNAIPAKPENTVKAGGRVSSRNTNDLASLVGSLNKQTN